MNVRFTLSLRSLATAGIIALALPLAAQATNITFTDAVLKAYVVAHYDKDGDSEISEAEALLVTAINVYGGYDTTKAQSGTKTKIASFADIANFPNLDTLDCSGNELAVLDVSKNTKLTYLACSGNWLTSLDVSKNTSLMFLNCDANWLTALDVSKNTSLTELYCSYIGLTVLDVSKNTSLTWLDCSGNQLTTLDVSKNTKLTYLACYDNQLTSLDVSANTSLMRIFCNANRLTRVDVRTMVVAEVYCGNQDIDGDGTASATETDTLFLTASQLTTWNASYKSNTDNANVVATSAIPFTDAVLKAYVVAHYDGSDGTAKDGEISEAEALLVTAINVSGGYDTTVAQSGTKTKIASFADIANFPNLDTLDCSGNQFTTLDVSKNTSLTYLGCGHNQLTSLDVSANTSLKFLNCDANQLTSLDVSKNTSLTELLCGSNQLTSLDVSKNTNLTGLDCSENQFTALDVSGNASLTWLDCYHNRLTSLDVSKNTKLMYLDCSLNSLTSVDVSKNTKLIQFYCHNNQLTSLDVSKNTMLETLYCNSNRLTRVDARTMAVAEVYCGNQDIDGDGSPSTAETDTLFLTASQLTKWNASYKSDEYNTNVVATSATPFTDAVLKAYVVAHYDGSDGTAKDGEISEAEALLVTVIKVYGGYDTTAAQSGTKTKIASFADIANFPNLDTLDCALNSLTSLDVSKNTKLTYLACYDNQLTSLDVSKNTKLTYLDCHNNQFTSLDVSKNTELTVLYCAYDQLTSLDVSANTSLVTLFCYHNRLSSLDVSKNTKLMYFDCSLNSLTSVDVSKNTKLTQFYCHNNQLTSLDISANTSLKQLFCQGNRLTRLDARTMAAAGVYCGNQDINGDGSPSTAETDTLFLTAAQLTVWNKSYKSNEYNANVVATSATPFTDAVLKAYVVAHYDGSDGTAKDGEISEAEALLVTAINVYGGYDTTKAQSGTKTKIASFADIANFPNLDTLDCSGNELAVLDVSKNTKLTYLACYDNQLTSLDVSKNTKLTYLDCHNNQLASLDVSKNTELTVLYCAYDQLTSLDVSANASLATLFCYHNRLSSLDVSKNTKLMYFDCSLNSLTSVDVSKNTKLIQFYCHNNQLTTLDVSKNTMLETLYCNSNRLTRVDARTMAVAEVYCGNQDIDGDGSPSTAETDTLFLTDAQLTEWNKSYKSDENNANVVATSAIPFTDAVLKAYVVAHYDGSDGTAKDGEISEAEALLVTAINVSGGYDTTAAQSGTKTQIASFADIANFPNLDTLDCSGNQFTTLDVSKNTKLTWLDCSSNQLTSLDVSKNTSLKFLNCDANQLTSLDVSKNTSLTELLCGSNQLTSLDVSKNTNLTGLDCSENQFTALDVSGNASLTWLDCGSNQLTTLDVSKNTKLTGLGCGHNQLTSLDVSANTLLTYLGCGHNQLTSLDVSANTSLTQLSCNGNRLTRLDARTMAAAEVYCGNQDINGDGSPSTAETDTLFLTASQLTKWNASYKSNTDNANVVAYGFVTLALAVNDTAMGEVTGAGTYVLTDGKASVKIAATAKTGYAFSKWSDGDTSASRTLELTGDLKLTATFAVVAYKLALAVNDTAMGEVTGAGTYDYGTSVKIAATAKTGYAFSKWSDGDTSASRTVTIGAKDTALTATFAIVAYKLALAVNDTVMGEVTGAGTYDYGTSVKIAATAKTGYAFSKWSDGDTSASRTVTIGAKDTAFTATFVKKTDALPVAAAMPVFGVSVNGHLVTVSGVARGAVVRVSDMLGRSVLEARSIDGSAVLSLPHSGAYILRAGNAARKVEIK